MKDLLRTILAGAFALAGLWSCSEAIAQQSRTVVYSGQSIVKSTQVVTAANCSCGCGSTSGCTIKPNCELRIIPSNAPGVIKCNPFAWTPPSKDDCDCEEQKIDFYGPTTDGQITVDLPKKIKRCVETYKFERKSFDVCGCKVEVCVPCEICTTENSGCVAVKSSIPVKFKQRTQLIGGNPVFDIWAENVKGLPNPAVLGLELTKQQIKDKYGIEL